MASENVLTILGPTASGKTELACHLALELKAEIISADSRQVYCGMDIGTGKDIEEYTVDGHHIPYHLIDIKDPGYKYNIAEYQLDFHEALSKIKQRGNVPILCGGSGLYIETALKGGGYLGVPMDDDRQLILENLPDSDLAKIHATINPAVKLEIGYKTKGRMIRAIIVSEFLSINENWEKRDFPRVESLIIGINIDRDLRRKKITDRLSYRLNNGLIEEAQGLLDNGLLHSEMSYYGLEYKWLSSYLQNKIQKKDLFDGLNTAIHQFSKRQMTWFRRMEKNGYKIHWLDAGKNIELKVKEVLTFYGE